MISVIENPAGLDTAYLAGLNTCFAGAWDDASYRWYLKRPFASLCPDVVVVYDHAVLAAGVGINYRQLILPDESVANVAILTAAWTLPAYRGRWHLLRLIKTSLRIVAAKGCLALLSFATADNASATILRRSRAYCVQTFYVRGSASMPLELPRTELELEATTALPSGEADYERHDVVRFHYPTRQDWYAQFLCRPHPVSTVRGDGCFAVVEHAGTTDRLQFLTATPDGESSCFAAIVRSVLGRNREFFHFTTSESLARAASSFGLSVAQGYIMVHALWPPERSVDPLLGAPWHVQAGDRM